MLLGLSLSLLLRSKVIWFLYVKVLYLWGLHYLNFSRLTGVLTLDFLSTLFYSSTRFDVVFLYKDTSVSLFLLRPFVYLGEEVGREGALSSFL